MTNRNLFTPNALRNQLTVNELPARPRTTNWDGFGVYRPNTPGRVTSARTRKNGAAVFVVPSKSGDIRLKARTTEQRARAKRMQSTLRELNGLKVAAVVISPAPVAKPAAKLKFSITKVRKPFRLQESGNKLVTMWKAEAKGVRKYFVTRKAAAAFVKSAK